ncbi:MAG TPA: hypothetical protein PLH19_01110 [Anaerolineae bacterium]|nr:hypothetical protein [Anaerolineae bacterium]HQH37120.1 hypothetical protein [Anaerolineae bacterium]
MNVSLEILETQLNDFDVARRTAALRELLALADRGAVEIAPPADVANMHCHTFFSYNAYGYSPTALAWLAKKSGYGFMGIVDFDVLDGVEEFLAACDLAGVRGSAGMETRVFIPEFATREINSPGEPGIFYHMGIGFTSTDLADATDSTDFPLKSVQSVEKTEARAILASLRARAEARNRDMAARVNAYLDPVVIDYDRDVLPLTPAGNATERHIVVAYLTAAQRTVSDPAAFWAEKLHTSRAEIEAILDHGPKIQNLVRAKLMKRGGVGYVQPTPEMFPSVEEVNRVITACGALPCATWLDGTSAGEQAEEELLDLLIGKGVVALNIIPDRNWNIADPEVKRVKLQKLYEIVDLAQQLDLPLNVGTEMNAPGNRLVDDFAAPELGPVREAFMDGAAFIYGHTVMQRALGLGYGSAWAQAHFPTRQACQAFYTQVGKLTPPGRAGITQLQAGAIPSPAVKPDILLVTV